MRTCGAVAQGENGECPLQSRTSWQLFGGFEGELYLREPLRQSCRRNGRKWIPLPRPPLTAMVIQSLVRGIFAIAGNEETNVFWLVNHMNRNTSNVRLEITLQSTLEEWLS